MGYAVAQTAARRGAEVFLVSGPTVLEPPAGVDTIQVRSAAQMKNAVLDLYAGMDIVVKAAAVADYRPANPASHKLKKQDNSMNLELTRTEDILEQLGEEKKGQILIGFAAETEHLLDYAQKKVKQKNLDLLVANDVTSGVFGSDSATVHILSHDGKIVTLQDQSKHLIADRLLDMALSMYRARKPTS